MVNRLLCVLSGAAAVAACATYHPAPLAPVEIARVYQNRSLEAVAVSAEVKRIAPAAEWNVEAWDRLSLFAAALHSSPSIGEARAHAASAEAAVRAARAGPAMTLTLTAEYAGKAPESSPWLYGVTNDIPLDLGARRSSRINAAQFAAVAARYDYAEAVWTARMAIRRALAERFLTMREVSIAEELAQVRARQLMALERRVVGGEAVRSELERVRAEAAGDNRRLADAQARLIAASLSLAEVIGVPLSALDRANLTWDGFDAPASPQDRDVMALRETALLSRADILRSVAAYDQAESELRGEIARQWPEVHVGPGYTWERGLVKLPFSVGLALPSFDLNRGAIGAVEARRAEAGIHLEAVIARAQAAIDGALVERAAARDALARVRDVDLQTAKRVADQADQELASGAIDRVDWSATQAGLRLAELAEVDALRRLHAADAALEDALRRPLEGPELQIAPPQAKGDQR
ncbi:MAG: TolC family protein [Hyphomonadaceae bacterium]|nr:TolC family protein [Hyphomonadaceae bacterium]